MRTRNRQSGYTLIEFVIVLAIIGVLAVAGSYISAPRQKPAVQNLLAEIEGLVAEAHKYSGATLGNVSVNASGTWADGGGCKVAFQQVAAPASDIRTVTYQAFQDRKFAGIDLDGSGIATAVGGETLAAAIASNPDLSAELTAALSKNLFATGSVQINAFNKQFLSPFCIPVVGLREGLVYRGAPAGYVVVSGNNIYKFYKAGPGTANPWRRL